MIPKISNRTEVLIVQDIQERSHPFNTARLVRSALERSTLVSEYSDLVARHSNRLTADTAVLYPAPSSRPLAEIAAPDRPRQLLLLDGTWNQAKRLHRNWPQLNRLPHYRLSPDAPGQYRIRLEPNDQSLSTVEAVTLALSHLEPELQKLDQLIDVFREMVDRQLAHPSAVYSRSVSKQPQRPNIPARIRDGLGGLVVAYGEAGPETGAELPDQEAALPSSLQYEKDSLSSLGASPDCSSHPQPGLTPKRLSSDFTAKPRAPKRLPVYWVAQRLGGTDRFSATIDSDSPLSAGLLEHFQLDRDHFRTSISVGEFATRWRRFIRPTDQLVVYNKGTLRLLQSAGCPAERSIELKSINFWEGGARTSLTEFFAARRIMPEPAEFPGRAGRRLANVATLVRYLHRVACQPRGQGQE